MVRNSVKALRELSATTLSVATEAPASPAAWAALVASSNRVPPSLPASVENSPDAPLEKILEGVEERAAMKRLVKARNLLLALFKGKPGR